MPPEIRTEIIRGSRMKLGSVDMVQEREATIITDLRVTPWGRYDFGSVTYGPTRWVRDSTPD